VRQAIVGLALFASTMTIGPKGSTPHTIAGTQLPTRGALGVPLVGQGPSALPAFIQPAAIEDNSGILTVTAANRMFGFGLLITPATSGRMLITMTGQLQGAQGGTNNASVRLYMGTGTAPATNTPLVGTPLGSETLGALVQTNVTTVAASALMTGLAIGVPIWIDVAVIQNAPVQAVSLTTNLVALEF
jgi:hypothetical protein